MNEPTAPPPLRPFAERLIDTLLHRIGKDERAAKPHDWLAATILTLRDQIIDRWMQSTRAMHASGAKRLLSQPGIFDRPPAARCAVNLGMAEEAGGAGAYGVDWPRSRSWSRTRLWAMAGWGWRPVSWTAWPLLIFLPGLWLRHVNGMFRQRIKDGWQVEYRDWPAYGNPGSRAPETPICRFGGEVISTSMARCIGNRGSGAGEGADTPVVGWRGKRVNTLRFGMRWAGPIRLDAFNAGDHIGVWRKRPAERRVCALSRLPPAGRAGCVRNIFLSSA
jgi:starch phosphorylase